MNRMTDRCKNITLATTSLRPVIIVFTCLDLKVYSCSIFLFYLSLESIYQINVTITSTNQRQQTKVEGNKGIEHNRVFPQYTKLATLAFLSNFSRK